ncbi:hypothetical protein [Cryptosporangium arvum]|uniref:Uncharacterized protein n=1 Tax=Cryptosporangium arvum DSM 44712 TaxID=927661 RepID=A0A010ZVP9_9ACTN|nr:hypothetical protein [Cryptosporangium arvum]EXG81267.1 hypothetical protein CryarDRAFT_2377 [Cryptosporangium arvum DSM 44712]
MEPAEIGAILGAVLSGAGGEAGKQAWVSLTQLLRRRRIAVELQEPVGFPELDARRRQEIVSELGFSVAEMADRDTEFRDEIEAWVADWRSLSRTATSESTNIVSGGVQHGTVVQAHRIDGGVHIK